MPTRSIATSEDAAPVTAVFAGAVTKSAAVAMSVASVYPGTPRSTGSPAAASAASRVRGPPGQAEKRTPYDTDAPGGMIARLGGFQCVASVTFVRTVWPPSPQEGHGLRGDGQMPVALSCSAM
eukprot:6311275-Prymnesium_polylepis.1